LINAKKKKNTKYTLKLVWILQVLVSLAHW